MSFRHRGNVQPSLDLDEHTHVGTEENLGPGARRVMDVPMAVQVVENSSNPDIVYVGEAMEGTSTSDALWRIQKIDDSSGTLVTWADGNAAFDNVFDDRESLTYS